MSQLERWSRWGLILGMACAPLSAAVAGTGEDIVVEEAAPPSRVRPAPAASISRIRVVPVSGKTQVRIEGKGAFTATMTKLEDRKWLVLDFAGTVYRERKVVLGAPLGDILKVRGGQNALHPQPVARVVIELARTVAYTEASTPGAYTLTFDTRPEAGPDESDAGQGAVSGALGVRPVAGAAPAEMSSTDAVSSAAGGVRARVLHAMVTELPDRIRLIITADGVLRYKLSSQAEGRELMLSLYDVELKWSPPKLSLKEGPVSEVTAKATTQPGPQVLVAIKLRQAKPYHIRRDQNQVIVEVDRVAEEEQAAMEEASRKGDLMHRVTLNVQNENMTSLVKALAFEAGFDNVLVSRAASRQLPVTISLRDVPFAKAMNLILAPNDLIWKVERGVFKIGEESEFTSEMVSSALSGDASGGAGDSEEGGIVTRVFRLKYISVAGVGRGAAGMLDTMNIRSIIQNLLVLRSRGQVITDTRSNSLIVTDAASNMSKLGRIIRELDTPIGQVMIRARLVQVRHSQGLDLGINWSAERAGPVNPTLRGDSNLASNQPVQLRTGWLAPGFNLDATLNVLQTKGDAQVLLNPSIATMQDQQAEVATTQVTNFKQTIRREVGSNIETTDTFVPVPSPVTLIVTPHINPDKTVMMNVTINITESTPAVEGPPDQTVQRAMTQLIVRDSETGVIGGILRDRVSKTVSKVPVLGELPWFLGGGLFRRTQDVVEKLELVLFLTPSIAQDI